MNFLRGVAILAIFTLLMLGLFLTKCSVTLKAAEPPDIISKIEQVFQGAKSYELVAEFEEGKVQLYRVEYLLGMRVEICYVGIGYLHGYTIALDCD